jgi:hypothetical protein
VTDQIKTSGRFLKKAAQKFLFAWAGGAETSTVPKEQSSLLLSVNKRKQKNLVVRQFEFLLPTKPRHTSSWGRITAVAIS